MRMLTNVSKFLILAVLSCSLLLAWDNGRTEILSLGFTNAEERANADSDNLIWESLGREFQLDHKTDSAQVQAEIRKLVADQGKLYHILEAAGPYIYYIHKQTQARGLPSELALIPVIESEFNPNDHSKKGATGLWQLMPGTARELGVKVKSGYDGRRDVVASTNAALAYFGDLGHMFKGDWYLAIASYNCGQVKVAKTQKRTGNHDFWDLPLPKETKLYVPRLLAVAAIIKDPEKYGVQLPPVNDKPYFTAVKLNKPVALNQVAKSAGMDVKDLHELNPDYNHGLVSKKDGYILLVPLNKITSILNTKLVSRANPQTIYKP